MNNKQEPPMTPQQLRHIATTHQLSGSFCTSDTARRAWMNEAIALRIMADWLELHTPLYQEAVTLLKLWGDQESAKECVEWEKRKRALLAKVKGE